MHTCLARMNTLQTHSWLVYTHDVAQYDKLLLIVCNVLSICSISICSWAHCAEPSHSWEPLRRWVVHLCFWVYMTLMNNIGIVWPMCPSPLAIWTIICWSELLIESCRNWCGHVKFCECCSMMYNMLYTYIWSITARGPSSFVRAVDHSSKEQ